MGILLFELFRNPLFMGILNKWETLVKNTSEYKEYLFSIFGYILDNIEDGALKEKRQQ